MRGRPAKLVALLALAGPGLWLCGAVPGVAEALLMVTPALALVIALSLGFHPGEATLARLAARRAPRRRRPRCARVGVPRRGEHHLVAPGGLLARSLAGRGPPASAPA